MTRHKEQSESLSDERDKLNADCQRALEAQRRSERQARDVKEEHEDMERKQSELTQKRQQLVSDCRGRFCLS